jgi:dolichyl-phosphate beta-glucosyltransferase
MIQFPRMDSASPSVELSVVIPAYKEAARLPRTLVGCRDYLLRRGISHEILVIDDGSSDDTASVAASFDGVTVLRYAQNRGKGYAVRYGMLRARGDRILFMDADLATPMEELEKLEAALDNHPDAGVAFGSRPLRDSTLEVRQPLFRELSGRLFNKAVRVFATSGYADTQCGFKLFTAQAAREIFTRCKLDGFSFDVELLFLALRLGYRPQEVPVRWAHQEGAAAFATRADYLRHGARMLRDITRIRWMHRRLTPVVAPARNSAP